jgi:protein gp37
MGENSKIEWTDHTFNPWTGCTKVSPGCDHCYAEAWSRRSGLVEWGNNPRRRTSQAEKPLKWNLEARTFKEEYGRRPPDFLCVIGGCVR